MINIFFGCLNQIDLLETNIYLSRIECKLECLSNCNFFTLIKIVRFGIFQNLAEHNYMMEDQVRAMQGYS